MNDYTKRLFQGTISLSVFFLTACLVVYFCLPANVEQARPVAFNSYTALLSDASDDTLVAALAKNDDMAAFSARDDKGLALYRSPKTRPAVEWFYMNLVGSRDVALAILEHADKNNIPVSLAFSLAYVESKYKSTAVNHNTNSTIDRGLFQLNSATFPKLTEADFFNPRTSAKYGMQHLRFCMDVAGNEATALAIYNAGTARVKNNAIPQQTLSYVGKIENYRTRLERSFTAEVYDVFQRQSNGLELAMAR